MQTALWHPFRTMLCVDAWLPSRNFANSRPLLATISTRDPSNSAVTIVVASHTFNGDGLESL